MKVRFAPLLALLLGLALLPIGGGRAWAQLPPATLAPALGPAVPVQGGAVPPAYAVGLRLYQASLDAQQYAARLQAAG